MKTTAAPSKYWTDEDLLAVPEGERFQLIQGEFSNMSPVGGEHGLICTRLLVAIGIFLRSNPLGELFDSSTGFRLDPENCFAADVAFVSNARLPEMMPDIKSFLRGAPDLAIEVLSPSNRLRQIEQKMRIFFSHGTTLGWMVLPEKKHVRVYSGNDEHLILDESATLEGSEVLPGFKLPIRDLFNYPRVQR
jgi:Uma2 family endonuclease